MSIPAASIQLVSRGICGGSLIPIKYQFLQYIQLINFILINHIAIK